VDLSVILVCPECREVPVRMVLQEDLERLQTLLVSRNEFSNHRLACHVPRDHVVFLDILDSLVIPETRELMEDLE